ncbi:hypothetical protein SLEP1_g14961 [Rubroshorea leprosula]|uniref:Uncharacterized protein n=1 Tax=Rubroshorea leprosula TaxID=152421 RepID=A0AAV5IXG7_9ROSI|nr:hypothetical protein SLEP1_g14961 [Rubroshorea leprosula]
MVFVILVIDEFVSEFSSHFMFLPLVVRAIVELKFYHDIPT